MSNAQNFHSNPLISFAAMTAVTGGIVVLGSLLFSGSGCKVLGGCTISVAMSNPSTSLPASTSSTQINNRVEVPSEKTKAVSLPKFTKVAVPEISPPITKPTSPDTSAKKPTSAAAQPTGIDTTNLGGNFREDVDSSRSNNNIAPVAQVDISPSDTTANLSPITPSLPASNETGEFFDPKDGEFGTYNKQ